MQIQIYQDGAVMGPYSEKQVRQFLAEGRLLPSDMARLNKNTEWSTVEHILAVSAVLATLPLPAVKTTAKPASKPVAKLASKTSLKPMAKPGQKSSSDTSFIP